MFLLFVCAVHSCGILGCAQRAGGSKSSAGPPFPDAVEFPSAEVEFIAGPQIKSGSRHNPVPWFDSNATSKGHLHGAAFPQTPPAADPDGVYFNQNYYDQALCQYINYYRTGDVKFRDYARKIADTWYKSWSQEGTVTDIETYSPSPRGIGMSGLMLRAMDGRPDMWPWLTGYTRRMFDNWVGARVAYDSLYFGVRDGGYLLLFVANMARAHPEAGVRAEFKEKAVNAAVNYYARLQYPDGSWRWYDDFNYDGNDHNDGVGVQPFMVGLLLEAMIQTHRLVESDPKNSAAAQKIKASILKACEFIYNECYRREEGMPPPAGQPRNVRWRGMWYVLLYDPKSHALKNKSGRNTLDGGWDTNGLREVRQLNATVVHAFGYAFATSREAKFREWGDEIFDATFGKSDAPFGYGLADFREKEYNQSYRSAGRYLAWRLWGTPASQPVSALPSDQKVVAARKGAAEEPAASRLVSTVLATASGMKSDPSEAEIATLLQQIEDARQAFTAERNLFLDPEGVLGELNAAHEHARNALAAAKAGGGTDDTAKIRIGWAEARLKRASERLRPK